MKPGPQKQFDPEVALEAAIEVFRAHGYEGASLSELMSAMGIGKKSLYDTFGNKRSLFIKALSSYADRSVNDIRTQLNPGKRDSIISGFRRLIDSWIEINSMPRSHGCLIGTCIADFDSSDVEMAQLLRQHLNRIEDVITTCLEQAEAAGEVHLQSPPRDIARAILCLSQGAALVGRVTDSREVIESALKVVTKDFLKPAS